MTTSFPAGLDAFGVPSAPATTPLSSAGDSVPARNLTKLVEDMGDAVEALQAKVGIDASAVVASLDYKVARRVRTDADSTLAEGVDIAVGTATGSMIATASNQKLGFFGAAPIVRPAAYTQTDAGAGRTHTTRQANTVGAAVAATAATQTTPFGFTTAAQPNDLVARVNQLIVDVGRLRTDLNSTRDVVNSVVDDLQALGLAA